MRELIFTETWPCFAVFVFFSSAPLTSLTLFINNLFNPRQRQCCSSVLNSSQLCFQLFLASRWSTGCTVPTTLCKRHPTAPSTVWSIPLTHRWSICGTRGRWRPIRRRPEATWVCQPWWSRAYAFPPERRWWERSTPRYWSSRRKRRRSR